MIYRAASIVIGYIFGNFQSSYILVKAFRKKDIRTVGSNNAGTMNTILNEGIPLGLSVFALDFFKTMLSSYLCIYFFADELDSKLILAYVCLGVALGHEFPFWLGFRGGKGVAVALAFLVVFDWRILAVTVVLTLVAVAITRKLWLGSTMISIVMTVGAFLLYPIEVGIIILIQAGLIVVLHIVHLEDKVV